jgi:hypothetical protein
MHGFCNASKGRETLAPSDLVIWTRRSYSKPAGVTATCIWNATMLGRPWTENSFVVTGVITLWAVRQLCKKKVWCGRCARSRSSSAKQYKIGFDGLAPQTEKKTHLDCTVITSIRWR